MSTDETARRDILGTIAATLPLAALLARAGDASAQPAPGTAQAGTRAAPVTPHSVPGVGSSLAINQIDDLLAA